jgi:hypothetical protein
MTASKMRRRCADCQRRRVERASLDSPEVMAEARNLLAQPLTFERYAGRAQARNRLSNINVEIGVSAERFDDAEFGSGARPSVCPRFDKSCVTKATV